jgi:hypothetical protein
MPHNTPGLGAKPNGTAGAPVVGVERTAIGTAADVRQRGIRETNTAAAAKQQVPGVPKFDDDPIGAISFALREVGAALQGKELPSERAKAQAFQQMGARLQLTQARLNALKTAFDMIDASSPEQLEPTIKLITNAAPDFDLEESLRAHAEGRIKNMKGTVEGALDNPLFQAFVAQTPGFENQPLKTQFEIAEKFNDFQFEIQTKIAEQTALAPGEVRLAGEKAAVKRQTPEQQAAVVTAKKEAELKVTGGGQILRPKTKAADGYWYYDDDKTRVFPNAEKPEEQGSRRFQNLGAYVDQETGKFVGEVTFDTRTSERTINIDGKEQSVPAGVIPITESNLHKNAMTGEQFFSLATEVHDTERGLRELTRFMADAKDTRQGWQLLADQFLGHMNTIFGSELSEEQFKTFASTGRLQGLLGAYRKEVVGGGVMTEQDALRVIARLGGDFNLLRNRDVAAALIRELMEEKLFRYNNLLLPMFNGQLTTANRRGFSEKETVTLDESVFSITESKIPPPPPGAVIDQ